VAGLHGLADQIAAVETDGNGRLGALEQEIGGRLGALEADLGGRFATVQDDFGGRLATLEREMGGHLATLEREMGGRLAGLEREMGGRLAGLEQAEAEQRTRAEAAEARAEALGARLAAAEAQVDRLGPDIARSARAYSEVTRRLDLARFRNGEDATPPLPMAAPEVRTGLDALLDTFYNRLEDRYRGTRADIRDRLRVYLPDVAAARARADRPVLDLGCGRGEWVELLTAEGVPATGVDLNAVQIADARAAGLDVHEGDALRTLADAPDGAYSVITAHHLIEHLPFETVTWMTREALRVLAPGGILIYETPNPRNLIVGATTFHIDPTHRKPLGAEVMTTLLDTIGFHPVEARPLHPYGNLDAIIARSGVHEDVARLLFGPQDLAMIATRPKEG
jgi:O-antigen chain-terminating methyltransferase